MKLDNISFSSPKIICVSRDITCGCPYDIHGIVLKHLVRANIMNMMKHMWENKLLSDYKHGFVEGRSCTSRLLAVLEAWTRILDSGNAVDAIYLDFRKAFDTVLL